MEIPWRAGGEGTATFGVINESGKRIVNLSGSLDAELVYDACSQAVLPWSNAAEDWFVWLRDAQALPSLLDQAKGVHERAKALREGVVEKPLQELRELAASPHAPRGPRPPSAWRRSLALREIR